MRTDKIGGLKVDRSPPKSDGELLDKRLDEFNAVAVGRHDFEAVLMTCRDEAGEMVAGIKGVTGWDWLYVQVLWVAEKLRGGGMGTKLLEMAEDLARERGCKYSCLSTFSFQARPFYQKRGYEVFGELPEYPGRETMYFMRKRLG
jgi:GNAT superfamily N-acetyltransferase